MWLIFNLLIQYIGNINTITGQPDIDVNSRRFAAMKKETVELVLNWSNRVRMLIKTENIGVWSLDFFPWIGKSLSICM